MVLNLYKIKNFIKKLFIPITILLIPHEKIKPINIKFPFFCLFSVFLLSIIGLIYMLNVAVDTAEYYLMKKRLNYYSAQFSEINSTINSLKKIEQDFRKLFSFKTKEEILENIDDSGSGSIDIQNLKKKIKETVESVGEIKDYLRVQKDIYLSTPIGMPVNGNISSDYGIREHPNKGIKEFHSGIDISALPGTPVKATADGIVSFSGWSGSNGNLIVIEHGYGFSTFYAHNKLNIVKVGQRVKRGEIIGYVGSTGNTTGPHIHYEIWKDGKHVNPFDYFKRRS